MTETWTLVAALGVLITFTAVAMYRRTRPTGAPRDASQPRPVGDWVEVLRAVAPLAAALALGVSATLVAQQIIRNHETKWWQERNRLSRVERVRADADLTNSRLERVNSLLPYLLRGDTEKSAAILTIHAAGDLEFAVALARLFPSPGSVQALEIIARDAAADERAPAVVALGLLDTDQSAAAMDRVFEQVKRALVAFDGETRGGTPSKRVVAGVAWSDRWLFVPLGDLVNAQPRNVGPGEQRGRQRYEDGLARIHLRESDAASLPPVRVAEDPTGPGQAVFAIGLDSSGVATRPKLGSVVRVDDNTVVVRFEREPDHVPGSLLVLPSGDVVGMLSHQQSPRSSWRYLSSASLVSWFRQLDREQP